MAGWADAPFADAKDEVSVIQQEAPAGKAAWMAAPVEEPAPEKTDWEMAKESLGQMVKPAPGTEPGTFEHYKGMGREAFLESNPLVNLGAWAIKKVTGERTEGTLKFQEEPGFMESLKAGTKFMVDHPLTATAELAKGLVYSPELAVLALSKGPQMVEQAANMAKLGRTAREAAVLGERAIEGAVVMGGVATIQQAAQKEEVNWGEVGSSAVMGGAMMAGLHLAGKGLSAGGEWAKGGKAKPAEPAGPDRFSDTVDGSGEINSPGEAAYRQPNVFDGLAKDSELNARTRADEMMQRGASKKEADVATKRSPELESAMEAVRQRRESAKESFGRGVQQGEWLGPEEPRGPIELAVEAAGTDLVKAAEQRTTQRRIQAGEADPKLLAALGLTVGAGVLAAAYPEEAKQVAGGLGLAGALLMTGGKAMEAFPVRTLGGELAQGKYTLKTLERLPQNRTEIPKAMIEQELKRADVSKAEKDVLTEVLATKGEQVTAQELVRDFRLATGDHTLEAKVTDEYAGYGIDKIRDTETYRKGLGGRGVTDASGHTGIEVPTKAHAGRIQQYGKADPKLLTAMGVVGGGLLVGGLLAGDSKVAGAILGGIAGAGLLRLPRTLAGMGKTISPKQVAWNAARVGAVLGVGTYLGGKSGDPVYGAAVAAAIILGKNALPAAKKLTTDQFISLRNGNIAAQQRITDNLVRDINAAVPDSARRVAIAEALDAGNSQGLAPKELQVYRYVRQFLDTLGKEAQDASVIKGMRQNYVSYIVERDPLMSLEQESGILKRIFESGEGGGSGSPNTRFGKRGKYETFDEINAALKGSGLKLKTQDIGEIVGLYTKSMRTAIENKILLDSLKTAKTAEGMDYLVRADKNGNLPPGYEKLNHPQLTGYGVQAELVDSLKVVMNSSNPNVVTRGLHGLAMAVKRVQVFGSLFHAKSLMEVYINSMGKDFYSTKTGVNMAPINAALKMYREGGLGDTLDVGIRHGLSMQIPLDVSQSIIGNIGKSIDAITPRVIGKDWKLGTAVTDKIDWVNGKMDKLTWDYLHAGIKGAVFLKEFETMMLRNAEANARNPKIPLKSRELIAKEVATYANDLTGGLNWFQIAADAKTQLGRNLGMYFAGPEGQRFAQMVAFAPDWAISTLRAGFKAFGESDRTLKGLWKPENATDLYRRYALRSTLYWMTLLNGINYATSGHSVLENKDPTRIEFGDGTSMQAGKHTFEAVHAVMDPVKFAYNKLGFTPKMMIDLASGKSGYGDTAPKYDNFVGHAARTALPFTVNSATQPGITGIDRAKRAVLSSGGLPVYGTTPEQKSEIKIQRAAARERKRGVRKDWGGKE